MKWAMVFASCLWLSALGASASWAADIAKAQHAYSEGYGHFQNKQYGKALRFFKLALRYAPKTNKAAYAKLLYYAGVCNYQQKQWRAADSYLKRAKAYGLQGAFASQAGAMLAHVRTQMPRQVRRRRRVVRRRVVRRRAVRRRVRARPRPEPRLQVKQLPPLPPRPRPRIEPAPIRRTAPVVRREIPVRLVSTARQPPRRPAFRPQPKKSSMGTLRVVGIVAVVAGGIAAGVGSVLGGLASGQYNELYQQVTNSPTPGDAKTITTGIDAARGQAYASYALIGVGGASVVAGIAMLFLGR